MNFTDAELNADRASSQLSILLEDIVGAHPDADLAVIAHSLGARVALGALEQLEQGYSVDLLALVQAAVRSTSVRSWRAVGTLEDYDHGFRPLPDETCSGRFASAINRADHVINTVSENDLILRSLFGASDHFDPHDPVCFLPASRRANIITMGDEVRSRALGLPFPGIDRSIIDVIPLPDYEFIFEDLLDDHRLQQDLPEIDTFAPALVYRFVFEVLHPSFETVDLEQMLGERPENGWHAALRGQSGERLIEFLSSRLNENGRPEPTD